MSVCGRYLKTTLIRASKNLKFYETYLLATGINAHPCAVMPHGYIPVPALPDKCQVLRSSNSLCNHICQQTNIILRLSNFAKTVFIEKNKAHFLETHKVNDVSKREGPCPSPIPLDVNSPTIPNIKNEPAITAGPFFENKKDGKRYFNSALRASVKAGTIFFKSPTIP